MGSPKQVIPAGEMYKLLSYAHSLAMDFRSDSARVQALEHVRTLFSPAVSQVDKPLKDCFLGARGALDSSSQRAAPFFPGCGEGLHAVALSRKGEWIRYSETKKHVLSVSSEELASAVRQNRNDVLCAGPWAFKRKHLATLESKSIGLSSVLDYVAFLRYLSFGMEDFDELLAEKERRLGELRNRSRSAATFVQGLDPCAYVDLTLPGYAVFDEWRPGHTSRCTGTYLLQQPVADDVVARNSRSASGTKYYVHESHSRLQELGRLPDQVSLLLDEVEMQGQCHREPLSDEEKEIIKKLAAQIGTPQ
jgi:hypothetical protein